MEEACDRVVDADCCCKSLHIGDVFGVVLRFAGVVHVDVDADSMQPERNAQHLLWLVNNVTGGCIANNAVVANALQDPRVRDVYQAEEGVRRVRAAVQDVQLFAHVAPEDVAECLKRYQEMVPETMDLYACAACGLHDPRTEYEREIFFEGPMLEAFKMSAAEMDLVTLLKHVRV